MRAGYIVALLMIVLMVGCATKTETPAAPPAAPEEVPEPPTPPETAPETPPEAPVDTEAGAPVAEGELVVTSAGFDPEEMEVVVGTTITITAAEGTHKFTVGGKTTPNVEEGSGYDVTFDAVGKIRVFDVLTKKSAYVTVTEAMEE